jgi:hypothetical protein
VLVPVVPVVVEVVSATAAVAPNTGLHLPPSPLLAQQQDFAAHPLLYLLLQCGPTQAAVVVVLLLQAGVLTTLLNSEPLLPLLLAVHAAAMLPLALANYTQPQAQPQQQQHQPAHIGCTARPCAGLDQQPQYWQSQSLLLQVKPH